MVVANEGESIERVAGELTVLRNVAGNWRRLTSAPLRERTLLPGARINLVADIQRRLPTGQYRVDTALAVGGRLRERRSDVLDFVGDATVTDVHADVSLVIEPGELVLEGVPGGRRSTILSVTNTGEAPVKLTTTCATPAGLEGHAIGERRGTEFTCAGWVRATPSELELPAGGQRNLRIELDMPAEVPSLPLFYGTLLVVATHTDGTAAGAAQASIVVRNQRLQPEPSAHPAGIEPTLGADGRLSVTAQFANTGTVHWVPSATLELLNTRGQIVRRADMEGGGTRILPLGLPRFGGVLPLDGIEPGTYVLRAVMRYAEASAASECRIRLLTDSVGALALEIVAEAEQAPPPTVDPPAG